MNLNMVVASCEDTVDLTLAEVHTHTRARDVCMVLRQELRCVEVIVCPVVEI